MEPEILSAIIAVSGVLVSALISVLLSRSRSRRDLLARNRDLFGSQLIQRRFEHYPELYRVLSNFGKELRKIPTGVNVDPISVVRFRETRDYVFDWDSKHSYLMSDQCVHMWGKYYDMLDRYCAKADHILATELNNEETWKQIVDDSGEIENALKSDLGVYDVEFLGVNKFIRRYDEAQAAHPIPWKKRPYSFLSKLIQRYPWIVPLKHKIFGSHLSIEWMNK